MSERRRGSDVLRRGPVRWGVLAKRSVLVLATIAMIALLGLFAVGIDQYIQAEGSVNFEKKAENAVLQHRTGTLTLTFVKAGAQVEKNQVLGLLESEESLLLKGLRTQTESSARQWVDLFKDQNGKALVRAPIAGTFIPQGDWDGGLGRKVALFEVIGYVVKKENVLFEAHVRSQDIIKVLPGQVCRIRIWALGSGRDYVLNGQVEKVSGEPRLGPSGTWYSVLCSFDVPEAGSDIIRLGMDGSVKVKVGKSNLAELLLKKFSK